MLLADVVKMLLAYVVKMLSKGMLPSRSVWLCTCSWSAPNIESSPPPPTWGSKGRLELEEISRLAHLPEPHGPSWIDMRQWQTGHLFFFFTFPEMLLRPRKMLTY